MFALSSCLVTVFYTSIVYFNKIAITGSLLMSQGAVRFLNIALLSLWLVFSPLVGYIIDAKKLRSHSVMKFASFATMIFSPAALFYFDHSGYNISMFVAFQVVLTMLHIMFCASTPKLICSLFQAQMRNTNTSVSYAIGSSFTAAAVPFLNDYAFNCFGIKGIGIVIFIFAFIGFLACFKQER